MQQLPHCVQAKRSPSRYHSRPTESSDDLLSFVTMRSGVQDTHSRVDVDVDRCEYNALLLADCQGVDQRAAPVAHQMPYDPLTESE